MHRIFEVNYDLRVQPKPNYTGLYEELKRFPGWIPVLDSMWFIYTDLDAAEVYNRIAPYLHRNDYAWVNEVSENSYYGWLPKNAWEWLSKARKSAANEFGLGALRKVMSYPRV